jgi:hypothetical protein
MKTTNFEISLFRATCALIFFSAFGAISAGAQDSPQSTALPPYETATSKRIATEQRGVLSAAANNLRHLAETSAAHHINSSPASYQAAQQLLANTTSRAKVTNGNLVPVNDTGFDFELSRLAGFSQNGSSNAWCGQNIVVGYNDSFAYLYTSALGIGASFSGLAVSHNAGASFQASPFLDAGSNPSAFLAGEPVIACSGNDFYYSSLFQFQNSAGQFMSAVSVNRSTNGGDTWSVPIPAARKSADTHIIDKQWLAVDPNKPGTLYLTFTDFDYTFHQANGCGGAVRIAIELTTSTNNGLSWTSPTTVAQLCSRSLGKVGRGNVGLGNVGRAPTPANACESIAMGEALQASQVLVGNNGEIFVAYVAETSLDEQIIFRRSTDGGLTFSDSTSVAGAVFAGLGGSARLQSLIQTNSFPSLSIDRSQGASRGTLYLTWIDANRRQIPDFLAPTQTYGFGQVMLSKSTDQGRTWTPAAPVTVTPAHREQFLPSAAVDRDGTLAICYFDRRNDPENNGVDHYCSVSRDQGASFTHLRNTPEPFTPAHLTDGLMDPVNFGDYDEVSTDANSANAGFFNSFQTQSTGDANIVGVRF